MSLQRIEQYDVEGLPLQGPPHPLDEAATRGEDPRYLTQRARTVGKEFQAPLTQHCVERLVRKRQFGRVARAPFDR
jgi:hypothetical protein